ncbi:M-phase phosphoprotein 9 isoform 1-T1 [Synchiropus picturatus]
MSTDDSVSEDGSSSTALSHCHGDGVGGKESEVSLVSSEGTSASGMAISEVPPRGPRDITPGCHKIRALCVSSGQVFRKGKDLPFINPSSLEILRALVQEIQSSGETDPEIWKDCEGRWLHLFQLVEKQYQEQIVAQQQQYQRQIQLIQDEIKALVQLQNRQGSFHTHSDVSPSSITKWSPDSKDDLPTSIDRSNDRTVSIFTSAASPPHHRSEAGNHPGERATTMLSSGYGTLSTWETGPEAAGSPGDEGGGLEKTKPRWPFHDGSEAPLVQKVSGRSLVTVEDVQPVVRPPTSTSQTFTSWAQRQKLRSRRVKVTDQNQESTDSQEQVQTGPVQPLDGPGSRRSDSAMSELSGLTYWRLHEDDLYHPLPDSLDNDTHLNLQDTTLTLEPGLSLRKIYQNKQFGEAFVQSSPLTAQVLTLDPTASTRQSDRTSGFTSPSHFSSPSFAAPLGSGPVPSITPDSMVESGPNLADTDCNSEVSSVSIAGPVLPQGTCTSQDQTRSGVIRTSSKIRTSSTEEAGPVQGSGSSLDPVVLSLLRQNMRDKHARHVSDLRAYYESEIRTLREQLQLLPEDLDQRNQLLTDRCQHLEECVSEAKQRVQHLEASNRQLEEKLVDWPQRYASAMATIESLQQRLEQSRCTEQQKDSVMTNLRTRVIHLEDEVRLSRQEADQKEALRQREHKMLQELVEDYNTLVKEHTGLKNQLVSTENKLCDANNEIVDLKKTVSKLETQVKQLEHQNRAQARLSLHRSSQPCGAGLFHHPDLLLSPRRIQPEPDVTQQRSPGPSGPGSRVQSPIDTSGWRCSSPSECELVQTQHREQNQRDSSRRDLTPMMRALIQLEETRATESRAPWGSGQRNTVVSPDQRPKEVREGVGQWGRAGLERGRESAAAVLRARCSLSPEGQRSSSLPPPAQRNIWATPTKRETLLAPVSSKCSPKRCPTDNYSTAFGHMMPREEHLNTRADACLDQRRSLQCSPRKRLQFNCPAPDQLESGAPHSPGGDQLENQEPMGLESLGTKILTLSEAQQLCDELTQEKLQIEAALNRVTNPGARVGSQRTLDQEVLERRLDHVTRALVSARRTLKKLKLLGSAAV